MKLLYFFILYALTDVQIDKIFHLIERILDHSEKWLALVTTIVTLILLIRQRQNKRQLSSEIAENTAINVQSLEVANGRSQKIAVLTEEVAKKVAPDSPVVQKIVSDSSLPPSDPPTL